MNNSGWNKIKNSINTKLGLTSEICTKLDSKTCKTTNIIALLGSFIGILLISFWFFTSQRSKLILDKEGHIAYTKVWVYSILFAFLGPILYLSYLLTV